MRSALLILALVAFGGCTPQRSDPDCSAGALQGVLRQQPDLPDAVEALRTQIISAAADCDYDELDKLALAGSETFSYSFGAPSEKPDAKPGSYWQQQENDDEPVLAVMVRMLARPFGKTKSDDSTIYVWPSVAGENAPESEWASLERRFGPAEVEKWRSPEGYLGPRVGITGDGDWLFYVAGD